MSKDKKTKKRNRIVNGSKKDLRGKGLDISVPFRYVDVINNAFRDADFKTVEQKEFITNEKRRNRIVEPEDKEMAEIKGRLNLNPNNTFGSVDNSFNSISLNDMSSIREYLIRSLCSNNQLGIVYRMDDLDAETIELKNRISIISNDYVSKYVLNSVFKKKLLIKHLRPLKQSYQEIYLSDLRWLLNYYPYSITNEEKVKGWINDFLRIIENNRKLKKELDPKINKFLIKIESNRKLELELEPVSDLQKLCDGFMAMKKDGAIDIKKEEIAKLIHRSFKTFVSWQTINNML